jgi:putative transposase
MMEKLPRQVYTSEFRRRAVELVLREGLGIAEASRRLARSPKTLTNWVRRAKGGDAPETGAVPRRGGDASRGRVVAAAGERRAANGARHPKKRERVLGQGVAARDQMSKGLRRGYPVRPLCRVVAVSGSGFYAWLTRKPSARARFRERLRLAAQAAHQRTRQTYGARRLRHELAAAGFAGRGAGASFGSRVAVWRRVPGAAGKLRHTSLGEPQG